MDTKVKKLEIKLKDYHLFIYTLIILSVYFYIGSLIYTYIRPSNNGILLIFLTLITIISTTIFLYKYKKIQIDLEENEHV